MANGSKKPGAGRFGFGDLNPTLNPDHGKKLDLNRSSFLDILKIDVEDNRKVDIIGNRPQWKAIVLRVDGGGNSNVGTDPASTTFFQNIQNTVGDLFADLGVSLNLVKVKARIDVLHAGIPEPDGYGGEDGPHQTHIDRHPTFYAQSEDVPVPAVGEPIWVTFEKPEEYRGGIYLGPVKTSTTMGASGEIGPTGGAAGAFAPGNCSPPGLLGKAAQGDAIPASDTPPAPPPYVDKQLEAAGGIITVHGNEITETSTGSAPNTAALEAELASVRARKAQLIAARGEDFPTGLEDQKILRLEAQLAGIEAEVAANLTSEHGRRLAASQARAADANTPAQSPSNLAPTAQKQPAQACRVRPGAPAGFDGRPSEVQSDVVLEDLSPYTENRVRAMTYGSPTSGMMERIAGKKLHKLVATRVNAMNDTWLAENPGETRFKIASATRPAGEARYKKLRGAAGRKYPSVVAALRRDPNVPTKKLFEAMLIDRYGSVAKGRKWRAWNSPHETGLAFDIRYGNAHPDKWRDGSMGPYSKTNAKQKQGKLFKWLKKNAHRWGITPYKAEAWHWEVQLSTQAFASGEELIQHATDNRTDKTNPYASYVVEKSKKTNKRHRKKEFAKKPFE